MRRFEGQARLVRRGPLGALKLAGGGVAIALLVLAVAPALFMPALVALASIGLLVWSGRNHRRPGRTVHVVAADASGVFVDGALAVPRGAIANAHATNMQDGHSVHVTQKGLTTSYSVVFEREAEAEAFLRALRLDERSNISRFRALPPWARHLRWLAVVLTSSPWILFNFVRLLPLWSWGLIAVGYGVIGLPLVLPQRVEVGHDGVLVRWLGNRRFIPFTQIEDVNVTNFGVELVLKSGSTYEIRLTQKHNGKREERTRLYDRLRDGLESAAEVETAQEEAILAQGERDVATWLRDMQQLGAGSAGGYRVLDVPHDRLWAVLENQAADPSAREGAAIALHASLDEGERERVGDLAATTASPRLRVALEGISRGDDETRLRVAIHAAELEDAEPPSENGRARRALRRPT